MTQVDPTYTDGMDRCLLVTVGVIKAQITPLSEQQTQEMVELLRKLIQGCLWMAQGEESEQ